MLSSHYPQVMPAEPSYHSPPSLSPFHMADIYWFQSPPLIYQAIFNFSFPVQVPPFQLSAKRLMGAFSQWDFLLFGMTFASSVAHMVKNLPVTQKTWVRSLGREDPWRRERQLTPEFLPGESHGQRSLASYSPWGGKESDMTERLSLLLGFCRLPLSSPLQLTSFHWCLPDQF